MSAQEGFRIVKWDFYTDSGRYLALDLVTSRVYFIPSTRQNVRAALR